MPYERVDSSQCHAELGLTGTTGTTITANGTPHNEGAWTQLDASTSIDADAIWLLINRPSAAMRGLLDIGIGASGQEVVLVDNFLIDTARANCHGYHAWFPVPVPAASRLAARIRASVGSVSVNVDVLLHRYGIPSDDYLRAVDTYGTDTTAGSGASSGTLDSGGSTVDPGASINTRGAWKELSSSIPNPISWLLLSVGLNVNTAATTAAWVLSVATGAASSEQVVATGYTLVANTTTDMVTPNTVLLPCALPAGARLAVAAECTISDATDRLLQVAGYGFR